MEHRDTHFNILLATDSYKVSGRHRYVSAICLRSRRFSVRVILSAKVVASSKAITRALVAVCVRSLGQMGRREGQVEKVVPNLAYFHPG